MTEGLDVLLGWLGLAALLAVLSAVMYRRSRRR
jgi:LPXTG-motif cell wall-anchored protein